MGVPQGRALVPMEINVVNAKDYKKTLITGPKNNPLASPDRL